MKELAETFNNQNTRLEQILPKLDIDSLQKNLRESEAKSLKSDFWEDIKKATAVMQDISEQRAQIKEIDELNSQAQNIKELLSLSTEETSGLDIEAEVKDFSNKVTQLETRLFLSAPYDSGNAFLSIHAGQGGVEAMDWAIMLLRMYERFGEIKKWKVTLVDETKGEEAGIKSATIQVEGSF
ncbi:MAG TPA: PCRF domain-containing protein, partial [Candidatus Saccharimonadales bacterium]|nr:PCRF domain-containing protein [Candidatus Saccharimonadales bacterium]